MPTLTRRKFLLASGATGAAGRRRRRGTGVTWQQLHERAPRPTRCPAGDQVLVVLTLYGGNDGLNTLVPYADPAYHAARPELAYAAAEVLQLDDQLGLNPAMTGLPSCGRTSSWPSCAASATRSRTTATSASMDIWQTASPDSAGQHRLDRALAGRHR